MSHRHRVAALLALSRAAIAAPSASTIATTKADSLTIEAVAAGQNGYAVVWQEAATDHYRIVAAIVDASGKVLAGPTLAFDASEGGGRARAAWNGNGFSIIRCAGSELEWGELAVDGKFAARGKKRVKLNGGEMKCGAVTAGDPVTVVVTSEQQGMTADGGGVMACAGQRVTLAGSAAKLGPKLKLCDAYAATRDWIVGYTVGYKLVLVTNKTRLGTIKQLDYTTSPRFAVAGKKVAVLFEGLDAARQAETRRGWLVPPGTTIGGAIAVRDVAGSHPAPSLVESFVVLGDERIAVASQVGKQLLVQLYGTDGKLGWGGEVTATSDGAACATDGTTVLCAWSAAHDVRAARIPVP